MRYLLFFSLLCGSLLLEASELQILPAPSLPVLFPREKASWTISAEALPYSSLEWTVRNGEMESFTGRATIGQEGKLSVNVPVDTAQCGYFSIHAVLNDGMVNIEAESAIAVVPVPHKFGNFDRNSFFGLAGAERSAEMVARLGAKSSRIWLSPKWTKFDENGKMDFKIPDAQMEMFRKQNLEVIMVLNTAHPDQFPKWSGWQQPGDMLTEQNIHHWKSFVRQVVERYKDKLYAIEIQNEPDISFWHRPGLSLDKAADNYARCLKVSYEVVKKAAPDVLVYGLDVSGRDFSVNNKSPQNMPGNFMFCRAVMEKAAGYMDVLAAHPYSHHRGIGPDSKTHWPEEHKLYELLDQLGNLMEQYKRPRRLAPTELGWSLLDPNTPVWERASMVQAAVTVQALVQSKAVKGVEKLIWFHLHAHNSFEKGTYNLARCNCPGATDYKNCRFDRLYPMPSAPAYAATAHFLEGTDFVKRHELNPLLSVWEFRRIEDSVSVFVFWARGEATYRIKMEKSSEFNFVSMFSNPLEFGKDKTLKIDYKPLFVEVPQKDVKLFISAMAMAEIQPVDALSVRRLYKYDSATLAVVISNNTSSVLKAELLHGNAKWEISIEPGVKTFKFPYSERASKLKLNAGKESIEAFPEPENQYRILYAESENKLLAELQSSRAIILDASTFLTPPDAPWNGIADLSVKAAWGWNENALLFVASVRDDKYCPDANPDSLRLFDSIRLGIDPEADSLDMPGSDDKDILLAGDKDGKGFSFNISGAKAVPEKASLKISRKDTETLYMLSIPWTSLGVENPAPGRSLNLSFSVNDNDGEGLRSTMSMTSGISGDGKILPSSFRTAILTRQLR